MGVLLPNVTISTSRAAYNHAPIPNLTDYGPCHAESVHAQDYVTLPAAALESKVKIKIDRGTDILAGDVITSLIQISDGQPWLPINSNEILSVAFVDESTSGFLPCRIAYINRGVLGGPAK